MKRVKKGVELTILVGTGPEMKTLWGGRGGGSTAPLVFLHISLDVFGHFVPRIASFERSLTIGKETSRRICTNWTEKDFWYKSNLRFHFLEHSVASLF